MRKKLILRQQQGIYLFFTKHIVAFDDIEYIKDLSEGDEKLAKSFVHNHIFSKIFSTFTPMGSLGIGYETNRFLQVHIIPFVRSD